MSVDVDTNFDSLLFVDLAKRNEKNKEKKKISKFKKQLNKSFM